LIRLTNTLSVTWPAVGVEVDLADFIGLETLRLLRANLYRALRGSKELLCGTGACLGRGSSRGQHGEYVKMLFGSAELPDQDRLRRALMRLFPRLESV
jgi:hypothetical protein